MCKTCGLEEPNEWPDGLWWAGAVWKCPECGSIHVGFKVPEWGLMFDQNTKTWIKCPPDKEPLPDLPKGSFAELEKRIKNL